MTRAIRSRKTSGAPANWQWREGRPRWVPSPALRKAGWKGHDLKDAGGRWLGKGGSIDAAELLNAAVRAWRNGALVPASYAAIAPAGAAETPGAGLAPAADRLSIGVLVDAFVDSDELQGKAAETRRFYKGSLKRLVDTLAGYASLPKRGDASAAAAYDAAVAEIRATHVLTLEPQENAGGVTDLLHAAYWMLHKRVGVHQASAVMRAAGAWLGWCHRRKSRQIVNWAADVKKETPPGRIHPLTWDEIKALIKAADGLGLPSIGDAIVLGLDLSWSQAERLSLTWPQIDENGRVFGRRKKTGRVGGTPLTWLGIQRVAEIRARQAKLAAKPTHVIVCERTGAPWKASAYRKAFANEVRPAAALDAPSVANAWDADLRDTAFSWLKEIAMDDDGIASRTLQKRKSIAQLGDRAYGEIGPVTADRAAKAYGEHLRRKGVKL